mmetsp:Transcript_231/g.408  ORF Transcript_231/g.408 Transcript_231/m.408 type:complete len:217 (-) Transcript_231:825-1475(-)
MQQVVDAHRLHLQHRVAEISALDLRDGGGQHLVAVGCLGKKPVALARARAPRAPSPLASRRLRDGRDDEGIHAELGVVHVLLDEAGVDHVVDAVNSQRGLGNVGADDDLACAGRRRLEDLGLHLGGEGRVDREDDELGQVGSERLHTLVEDLAGRVDLLLSRQEDEHVPRWLGEVDLHDGDERGVKVVRLGRLGIEDLNGEGATWDGEDGALEEVG